MPPSNPRLATLLHMIVPMLSFTKELKQIYVLTGCNGNQIQNNFVSYRDCERKCMKHITRKPQSGSNENSDFELANPEQIVSGNCPNGDCADGHFFLPPGLIEQVQNILTGSPSPSPSPPPPPPPVTTRPTFDEDTSRESETLMSQAEYCSISAQHTMCSPQVIFYLFILQI